MSDTGPGTDPGTGPDTVSDSGRDPGPDTVSDTIISAMSVAVASHSFPKHTTLRRELEARYPDVVYNGTGRPLAGDDLVRFLRGHDMAITGLEVLDETVFAAVPELRIVSKYGVGLDMIDLAAATRRGVSVRWTGGVNRQAVAELAIAFMLVLGRSTVTLAREMRDGGWRQPYTGTCPPGKFQWSCTWRLLGLHRILCHSQRSGGCHGCTDTPQSHSHANEPNRRYKSDHHGYEGRNSADRR